MTKKKVVNLKGLDSDTKETLSENSDFIRVRGINGDVLKEPIPEYLNSQCEKIWKKGDVWIVAGRDRSGHRSSGYGGKGHTKSSSLDIVIGRLGFEGIEVDESGSEIYVDPDFKKDAVRFYFSQKADIDDYFGLVDGKIGRMVGKSAVALKADGLRFISRGSGIKFVTNVDSVNSRGGKINRISGIDLIAGNDDTDLQPMVKGDNLIEILNDLVKQVEGLSAIVDGFVTEQIKINTTLVKHKHFSPFMGLITTPSDDMLIEAMIPLSSQITKTKISLITFKSNLVALKQKYLYQTSKKFIASRWNNTN